MALPSQSARSSGGRSYVYRRSRRRFPLKPLVALLLVGGVVYAGWRFWPRADDSTPPDSDLHAAPERPFSESTPVPVTLNDPESPQNDDWVAGGLEDEDATEEDAPLSRTEAVPIATVPAAARRLIDDANVALSEKRFVDARRNLNMALHAQGMPEGEQSLLREQLQIINERLVFSPIVETDDPFTQVYRVQSGEVLEKIVPRLGLAIDWRFLQRMNRIPNPDHIRENQPLKIITGPFHVVVDKSDYRLDLFIGPPDDRSDWTFVRSFDVGLGEEDSTPIGRFIVKRHSKLVDPAWTNPRTGEQFDSADLENPIGERWIGLEGLDNDRVHVGYGLHGTIEPDSIGTQQSMGCVRLQAPDIELLYEVLVEEISLVTIVQ